MAAEIVTLCGSRKYAGVFKTVARTLSKRGIIVLAPVFSADIATTAAIQGLRRTHFKKIDLADAILVIDVHGYIGEQTKQEIKCARRQHKKICYYSAMKAGGAGVD